jgi:hypothetical protein
MAATKKVVAVLVMIVAVTGLLVSLVAIIGVWTTKAGLAAQAELALDGITQDLRITDGTLAEIDSRIGMGRAALENISTTAGGTGDELGESKGVELAQMVETRLSEIEYKIGQADERLGDVEARINGILATVNKLPGVQVPPLDVRVLDDFGGLLSDANTGVRDLADTVTGGKASVVEEMKAIEQEVTGLRSDLDTMENSAMRAQDGISAAEAKVAAWQSLLSDWLQRAAVFLTVALIWFAFGQIGLFMWMRSVYHGVRWYD